MPVGMNPQFRTPVPVGMKTKISGVTDPDLGSRRFCQMVLTAVSFDMGSYCQDHLTKLK